ncbi:MULTISPECIES: zinc metalloprotease [unclassified Streptomyces]|uniref:zinc metalloprotease n=1 Tax=unclassified Streptomyces TaxID=2593676 RepID=UPI002E2B0AE9|nr:zinc metalloprotease [Streptomyces sp. NBC_00228]
MLATATVPVYWHTISAAGGAGRLSGTAIDQQITILNHAYAPVGLKFELAEVEDAVNTEWFYQVAPDSQEQTAMKKALRKGGADALNIYSTELSDSMRPIRGYATYPWRYRFAESDDGVVLRYTETGNLTAVHEVGHWAGLYSTYENGCSGPGDMVDDTPAQAFASSGCPEGRDTCSQRGTDPIHNFMDGNEDTCRNQFTPGQVERAREVLRVFRGIAT